MANTKQTNAAEEEQEIRRQDREWFIKFWAAYMKKTPNKVWGRQQNMLIDSQIQNASQLLIGRDTYLRIKGEAKAKEAHI